MKKIHSSNVEYLFFIFISILFSLVRPYEQVALDGGLVLSGKILYPERNINSVYFDNDNLSMYHDSIEGSVPRKKIRIR